MTTLDHQQADTMRYKVFHWLCARGCPAYLNIVALLAILFTLALLLQHRVYWASSLFVYRKRYILLCVLLTVLATTVAYVIYKGGRATNRYLSLIFACALVLGEFSAQYATLIHPFGMKFRQPHPYLGFSGKAGLQECNTLLAKRMGGTAAQASIHLNELGYRGPLPDQDKQGEYRIIMLGGSTVFVGSPLEKSIPGQLELMLTEAGVRDVRVYNWGMVSAVSGQELAAIAHRAIDYNPDLIIVYNGANDATVPFTYDPRPGYPYNYFLTEVGQKFTERRFTTLQMFAVLLQKSRAVRVLLGDQFLIEANHIALLRRQCGYGTAPWRHDIAMVYGQNLSRMATVCKGNRSRLAVFLQPILIHKNHLQQVEIAIVNRDTSQTHCKDVYPRLVLAAGRALGGRENEGIYFSDISRALENVEEEIFWDHLHVNNHGNELIAREMVRHLLPIIHQDTARIASAKISSPTSTTPPEPPQQ